MAKKFVFPGQQRMSDECPVCSYCNVAIAAGQKRIERGGHVVHGSSFEDCAALFDRAMEAQEGIDKAFSGMPTEFFSGSDLRERLNAVCTVQSARTVLLDFAGLLRDRRCCLVRFAEVAFHEACRLVKEIGRMLRVEERVAEYGL